MKYLNNRLFIELVTKLLDSTKKVFFLKQSIKMNQLLFNCPSSWFSKLESNQHSLIDSCSIVRTLSLKSQSFKWKYRIDNAIKVGISVIESSRAEKLSLLN